MRFVAQPVQVGDEIAHMGVVHGALRFRLPRVVCRFVIGKNPNDMNVIDIAEHGFGGVDQFAARLLPQELAVALPDLALAI